MKRTIALLSGVLASLISFSASTQNAPEVTLTRLDCGTSPGPSSVARFSDAYAYEDKKLDITFSCYLIKHGDDYLVWDTGNPYNDGKPSRPGGPVVKESLLQQLAQLNLKPEQIKYVGISHYHGDHTGQVGSFPQSTLLIGKGDWDVIAASTPSSMASAAAFAHWISGGGKVEPVPADKDVFGDGTVVMLNTPGHTPGHHSLLVRLKKMGNVVISGDAAHFRENYDNDGVPSFNTDRADTLASLDRIKHIVANLKATLIVQHDARDIAKLPPFPKSAQ